MSWLKVGELARRTGLTVRTLHFYDEIGLLKPSARTDAGHRVYAPSDVARLQRITSLRQVGLTLEAIGDLLDGREGAPERVIRRHIAHVRQQLSEAEALFARLEHLARVLEARAEPSVDDLLHVIEETVMLEKYYTKEQLEELARRREELGEEGMRRAQQDWADLIAAVKAEKAAGTPADDPRVLELARRWKALIEAFTGGDPGIRQGLQSYWDDQRDAMAERTGIDRELMAWLGPALAKA